LPSDGRVCQRLVSDSRGERRSRLLVGVREQVAEQEDRSLDWQIRTALRERRERHAEFERQGA
jgi:hypothetical protein